MIQLEQTLFGINRDSRLDTFENHKFIEMYVVGIAIVRDINPELSRVNYHITLSFHPFMDVRGKNYIEIVSSTLEVNSLYIKDKNLTLYNQKELTREKHLTMFKLELDEKRRKMESEQKDLIKLEEIYNSLKV